MERLSNNLIKFLVRHTNVHCDTLASMLWKFSESGRPFLRDGSAKSRKRLSLHRGQWMGGRVLNPRENPRPADKEGRSRPETGKSGQKPTGRFCG